MRINNVLSFGDPVDLISLCFSYFLSFYIELLEYWEGKMKPEEPKPKMLFKSLLTLSFHKMSMLNHLVKELKAGKQGTDTSARVFVAYRKTFKKTQ